jgi:hypothetical protein
MAEISIIDIRQGPVGPAGPAANVTQANIEAAITDKPGFREEIAVNGSLPELFDDFTIRADGTVYQDGSLPLIGAAYQFIGSNPNATVTGGKLLPTSGALYYMDATLVNPVRDIAIEFTREIAAGGAGDGGIVLGISKTGEIATDLIHIRLNRNTVYVDLGTPGGTPPMELGVLTYITTGEAAPYGTVQMSRIQIIDDLILIQHEGRTHSLKDARIASYNGNHVFFECLGSAGYYSQVGIKRIYANTPGGSILDGTLASGEALAKLLQGEPTFANDATFSARATFGSPVVTPPANTKLAIGPTGSSTSRGFSRPFGGALYIEAPIIRQVGNYGTGNSQLGVARHAVIPASHITAPVVNATTGSEVTLRQMPIQLGLENGDSQEWDIYGNFTAAAAGRRIIVKDSVYGNVVYNSNASGTPLDGFASGTPWHLKIFNPVLSAANFTVYATLYAGGTLIGMGRISGEYGTISYNLNINIVQATTNSISIEGIVHTVNRVVVPTS